MLAGALLPGTAAGAATSPVTAPSGSQAAAPPRGKHPAYYLGSPSYWLFGANGAAYPFGARAGADGTMASAPLDRPVVAAATPFGAGYWLVASDGGVFSFGAARFYGSMGGHPLNAPIVGVVPGSGGGGYYLVASDGGIFAFGAAGSTARWGAAP